MILIYPTVHFGVSGKQFGRSFAQVINVICVKSTTFVRIIGFIFVDKRFKTPGIKTKIKTKISEKVILLEF